jgi:hypothetical protein
MAPAAAYRRAAASAAAAAAALLLLLCATPAAARTSSSTAAATWPARTAATRARGGRPVLPRAGACRVPQWEPTWLQSRSTIVMPCNDSGLFDPALTARFGVVDFDWSNAKAHYVNQHPMTCEEDLVAQAALVKAVNPDTKVLVYRNLVKSLPFVRSESPRCFA